MKRIEFPAVSTEPVVEDEQADSGSDQPSVPRLDRLYRWLIGRDGEIVGGDLEEFFLQEARSEGLLFAYLSHINETGGAFKRLPLQRIWHKAPVHIVSRAIHYPAIYVLLALSYLMPTPVAFQGYLALILAGALFLGLVLGILILTGKIRPDAYWGRAGGNFMLAFFATLCFVNLFLVELTLEQWAHAYGFTLGLMQVFVLRWLWPQLFDQDSDWAKKQREPTVLKIPRGSASSGRETDFKL